MFDFMQSDKKEKSEDQEKVEYTELGFWESTLKNNYRRISVAVAGLIFFSVMVYYQAFLFGLTVLSFTSSFIVAYYFWLNIQTVPETTVIQTDLQNRIDRVVHIPNKRLADFEIKGNQETFRDQEGTDIIHADRIDLKNEVIECAYSHKVSTYELSIQAEALDQAKQIAQDSIKENAKYKWTTRELAMKYANDLLEEAIVEPLDTISKDDQELQEQITGKLEGEDLDRLDDLGGSDG